MGAGRTERDGARPAAAEARAYATGMAGGGKKSTWSAGNARVQRQGGNVTCLDQTSCFPCLCVKVGSAGHGEDLERRVPSRLRVVIPEVVVNRIA